MKITINKTIFEQMLSNVIPFLEKKDNSQITSHIYIEAKDGALTIKGTDNEIGLKITNEDVNVINEGFATANGKKIADYVRNLKDDIDVERSPVDDCGRTACGFDGNVQSGMHWVSGKVCRPGHEWPTGRH